MKTFRYFLEYCFLLFITLFINLIPFKNCKKFATLLKKVLSPIFNSTRKRIKDNLNHAFPQMPPEQVALLIEKNLIHTLTIFLETGQGKKLAKPDFVKRTVIPDDEEKVAEIINSGSAVIVEGHLGNWELPPALMTSRGLTLDVSAAHIQNPYVDKMTAKIRSNYGCGVIYLEESKKLIRNLKKGFAIGLVADQDAGQNGVFVPFFGREASTYTGPALLAWLTESRLEFFSCIRQENGTYKMSTQTIEERVSREKYPNKDQAIVELTSKWVNALENVARQYPEQYFWAHRRWKTRPATFGNTDE